MTIALFTEDGPTGEAIRILAEKVLAATGTNVKIKRRQVNRGDIFKNPRKLGALVELAQKKETAKVIICVDSECTAPEITEQNLIPCKKHFRKANLAAQFVVVVHALETWLMADTHALRSAFNLKGKIKAPSNFEAECRPGEMLKRLLKKHGFGFIKSRDDVAIAEHANPEVLAQKCSSFARFRKILLAK